MYTHIFLLLYVLQCAHNQKFSFYPSPVDHLTTYPPLPTALISSVNYYSGLCINVFGGLLGLFLYLLRVKIICIFPSDLLH